MNKRRKKRVLRPWINDFIIKRRPATRRFSKAVVVCCDKGTTRNGWNIKEIEDGTVFIKAYFTKSAVSKALGETGSHEDWRTAMLLVRDVKVVLEHYGPNKQSYEFVLVIDDFVIWDSLFGLRANNTIHWCMNYADVQESAAEFVKEMEQKAIGSPDETGDHSDSLSISQLLQEIAEASAEIETSTSFLPSVERNKSDKDWMELLKKPLTVDEFLIPKETESTLNSIKEWDANYRPSASSSSSSSSNQSASAREFNIEKISTLTSTNNQPQVIHDILEVHEGEKEHALGDDCNDSVATGQAVKDGNRLSAGDSQSQSEVSMWQDCMDSVQLSDESLDMGSPDAQSTQKDKSKASGDGDHQRRIQMEEKGQTRGPKTAVLNTTNNKVVKNNEGKVCVSQNIKEPDHLSSDVEVVQIKTGNSINTESQYCVESDSTFIEIASWTKSPELITANEQAELNRLGALTVNWSTSDPSSTNQFSQSTLYHKSILDENETSGKSGNSVQPNPQKVNKGSEELFVSSSAEESSGKSGEKDSHESPCDINMTNHKDDENVCNSSREIVSPSPENTAKKRISFSFSLKSLLVGGSKDVTIDSSASTTEPSNSEVEANKDSSAVVTNSNEEESGGERGVMKIRSMISNLMQKFQHNSNVGHKTKGCSGVQKVQSSSPLQQTNVLRSSQGNDDSGSEHSRSNSEKNIMIKYYTEGSPIKSHKSIAGLNTCMSLKARKRKTIGCAVESSTSGQCNNSQSDDKQLENDSNSEDRQTNITIDSSAEHVNINSEERQTPIIIDSSAEHVNTIALPQTDVRDTESLSLDTNYDFTPSDKQAEAQSKEISIEKHNFVTSLMLIDRQSQMSQAADKISPSKSLKQASFEWKRSSLRLENRKTPFQTKQMISSSENRPENDDRNDKQAIDTSSQTHASSNRNVIQAVAVQRLTKKPDNVTKEANEQCKITKRAVVMSPQSKGKEAVQQNISMSSNDESPDTCSINSNEKQDLDANLHEFRQNKQVGQGETVQTSESDSEEEMSSMLDTPPNDLVKPCFVALNRLDEGKLLLSAACDQQSEELIEPGDDTGELASDSIEQSTSESPSAVKNSETFHEGIACDNTNFVINGKSACHANLQVVDQSLHGPPDLNNKVVKQCKKRNGNMKGEEKEKRSPRSFQSRPTNRSISCKKSLEEVQSNRKDNANNLSQKDSHKCKSVEVDNEGLYFNTQPMTHIQFHESQGFQPMFSQERAVSYLGINIEMKHAKPSFDSSDQSLTTFSMTAGLLEDDNEGGRERCVSSDNTNASLSNNASSQTQSPTFKTNKKTDLLHSKKKMGTRWMTQGKKFGLDTELLDNRKTTVHSKETEKCASLKDDEHFISKITNNLVSIADENVETEELHTVSEMSEIIISPEEIATKESAYSGNYKNLSIANVNDKTKSVEDVLIQNRFGRFKGPPKISQIQGTQKTPPPSISLGKMANNHTRSKSPKVLKITSAGKRKRSPEVRKRNTTVVNEGLQKSKRARIDADSPRKSTVASNAEIDYLLGKLPPYDVSRDFVKTNSSVNKSPSNEAMLITMFPVLRSLDRKEYQVKAVNKSRSKTKKDASDIFGFKLKGVKRRHLDCVHDSLMDLSSKEDSISLISSMHSENETDLSDIDVLNKQRKRESSTPKKSQIGGTLKTSGEKGKKHMFRTSQLNLNVDKMTGAFRFSRDQGFEGQMIEDQNSPKDKLSLKRLKQKRNEQHSEEQVVNPDMVKCRQNTLDETTTSNQGNVSCNLRKRKPLEIPLPTLTENRLKKLGHRAMDKDTLVNVWLEKSESQTSNVSP